MSEKKSSPPSLSTRQTSLKTTLLSETKLTTQFEITTSIELSSILCFFKSSMVPRENSTFDFVSPKASLWNS